MKFAMFHNGLSLQNVILITDTIAVIKVKGLYIIATNYPEI